RGDGIRRLSVTGVQTCALPIQKLLAVMGGHPVGDRIVTTIFGSGTAAFFVLIVFILVLLDLAAQLRTPQHGTDAGRDRLDGDLRSEERRVGERGESYGVEVSRL